MPKSKVKPLTEKQIREWKEKAAKWDALDEEISNFYADPDGDNDDNDEGLIGIGEAAARAFGYM